MSEEPSENAAKPPTGTSSVEPPKTFGPFAGRYQLETYVGSGAAGYVCTARDLKLNRIVAVKASHRFEGEARSVQVERMRQEAEIGASLQHPNIPRVLDFGLGAEGEADEGPPFLVQEFIDGQSLSGFVEAARPTVARIVDIALQLTSVLNYIHSRQPPIVHRDIRGDNILITKEGTVYLTDWGLSRPAGTIVTTEFPKGTRPYMAPEVIDLELSRTSEDNKRRIDGRADLFSLGVLLYLLLTGEFPWKELQSILKVLDAMSTTRPDPPSTKNPACPRRLDAVCLKLLAFNREDRYADAGALGKDLSDVLREVGRPDLVAEVKPSVRKGIALQFPLSATNGNSPPPAAAEGDFGPQETGRKFPRALVGGGLGAAAILGFVLLWGGGSKSRDDLAAASPSAASAGSVQPVTAAVLPVAASPEQLERILSAPKTTAQIPPLPSEGGSSAQAESQSSPSQASSRSGFASSAGGGSSAVESLGDELVVFDRSSGKSGSRQEYGIVVGTTFEAILTHKIVTTNIASPARAQLQRAYVEKGKTIFPAGARFIGRAMGGTGTDRIQIRFDRIILPNNEEVRFSGVALDNAGALGIAGIVDRKRTRDLARSGANVLARAGQVAASLLAPGNLGGDVAESAADATIEQGQEEVDYHTEAVTVITVESGTPVTVYVNQTF